MKLILHAIPVTAVLALGFGTSAEAQITIDENDMPTANDTFRITTTVDAWGIDPSITGAAYSWDFSFLTPLDQRLDTIWDVGDTPFAYQFFFNNIFIYPDHYSDFATRGQDVDVAGFFTMEEVFNYFAVSSNSYRQTGIGATIMSIPGSFQYSDIDTVYEFPLDYLNSSSSSWEYDMTIPSFGYYRQRGNRVNEVDGWGDVTTPFGNFNCLRVKSTINIEDSVYVDGFGFGFTINRPESIEYKWLANGMGVPVLTITESIGTITAIEYQDSLRVAPLSVNELSLAEVAIYPNPASEVVHILADHPVDAFTVYDLNGRSLVMGSGNEMDVAELAAGIYIVTITIQGRQATRKLIIRSDR